MTIKEVRLRASDAWKDLTPRIRAAIGVLSLLAIALVAWLVMRSGASAPVAEAPAVRTSGDTLVRLDDAAQRLGDIQLVVASTTTGGELIANGTITFDANRVSVVSPRTEARVVSVAADLGQQVRAGQILVTLASSEVGQTRGELQRAQAALEATRKNFEREKRLFQQQISPQKDLIEAEAAYRSAQADYNAAASKLGAYGANSGGGGVFGLAAPISGTVVVRSVSPGQIVGPESSLFTVADLSRVWITVNVFEADLSRITQGSEAVVIPTALRGEQFKGRVTYAGGIVDSASHTFEARVEVANPERKLRPGMFAQVRIQTPVTTTAAGYVLVPEEAVQDLNGKSVVFTVGFQPDTFIAREVVVGERAGKGILAISRGLKAGERIVAKGAFQLKAELMKASFGDED